MSELNEKRKKIDAIDKELIRLTADRLEITRRMSAIKEQAQLPIEDKEREAELKAMWEKEAEVLGISKEFAIKELTILLNESKKLQREKWDKSATE